MTNYAVTFLLMGAVLCGFGCKKTDTNGTDAGGTSAHDSGPGGAVDANHGGTVDSGPGGAVDSGPSTSTDAGPSVDANMTTGPTMMMVGAAGGSVMTSDGSGVTIPAGALASTVEISIGTASSPAAPAGATVVGPTYVFGPEGQTFSTPVNVTLAFDPARLPSGRTAANVVIYTAPVGSTTFTTLTTTVVDSTHVSAQASHFSVWVGGVGVGGGGCTSGADCAPGMICSSGGACVAG